ncbi:MAG: hypothetical protein AAGI38_00115 [Bacteroidota bacterium]
MSKFKRFLLFFLLGVFLLGGGFTWFALSASFSDGARAGTVVKLSFKGVAFKTWEGQLNTGGFSDGGGGDDLASTIWHFSVDRGNQEVLDALQDAMDRGYRVKLHYEEKFFQFSWRGDTKYFVDSVEKVNDD